MYIESQHLLSLEYNPRPQSQQRLLKQSSLLATSYYFLWDNFVPDMQTEAVAIYYLSV